MLRGETKLFQKGECIISKGDAAQKAFMLLQGRARVFLEKNGKEVTIAELECGSIFGENALFGIREYGANVEALDNNTKVSVITTMSFQKKIENSDPMLRTIIHMLIERQRITNEALLDSETREFMDIEFI